MKFMKMLVSFLWLVAITPAMAQSDVRPKLFELVFDTTAGGKQETLRTILIESRRGQIIVEAKPGTNGVTYKVQTYLLRKNTTAKGGASHLLHAQVFQQDAGKWFLVNEPTLEVRENQPASMSLDGGANLPSLNVSFREIPASQATSACAKMRGRPLTDAELDAAFQRLDAPSPNAQQQCCTSGCDDGRRLRCCWGALCCESGDCGCCVGGI